MAGSRDRIANGRKKEGRAMVLEWEFEERNAKAGGQCKGKRRRSRPFKNMEAKEEKKKEEPVLESDLDVLKREREKKKKAMRLRQGGREGSKACPRPGKTW